ncbi:tyrosine-type recombinase/integrase [Syntrophus gentianae]|nr:Arm DNA-binding domain-containing protein [Syntrophus gentianae]
MALNDMKIRKAQATEKPLKLFDGDGLFLFVTPQGGKLWRLKYRYEGKEKLLSLGKYPEIGLADARQRRDDARKLLAQDLDPTVIRKAQKQAKTEEADIFEVIAREWHTKFSPTWAKTHANGIMSRLERDIFPWIGKRPIAEINPGGHPKSPTCGHLKIPHLWPLENPPPSGCF